MAVHLLPIKAFPFWKCEALVFLSSIRKQGQCYLLVQPEYMQGNNAITMMWSFKNWIKFSSCSSIVLVEAEHQNEKAIQIGLGNMISPQSLHWNFMFLYRGLYFMQSISKSTTVTAEEPIQLYVYYKHMALAWLSPAGDTSWDVLGKKKKERNIFEILKRYIFTIFFFLFRMYSLFSPWLPKLHHL